MIKKKIIFGADNVIIELLLLLSRVISYLLVNEIENLIFGQLFKPEIF